MEVSVNMRRRISKRSFGRRHSGVPRVGLRCIAQGTRHGLENRLTDMVAVAAVVQDDVQIHPRLGSPD